MSKPARALLDVNVLIGLFTESHVHHEIAHDWFDENRKHGWATCPIIQNGFLRILGRPDAEVLADRPTIFKSLQTLCANKDHEFWTDAVSLTDTSLFDPSGLASHRHLTDVYLLGLARQMDGRLATFDSRIPLGAVRGATSEHLAVIAAG